MLSESGRGLNVIICLSLVICILLITLIVGEPHYIFLHLHSLVPIRRTAAPSHALPAIRSVFGRHDAVEVLRLARPLIVERVLFWGWQFQYSLWLFWRQLPLLVIVDVPVTLLWLSYIKCWRFVRYLVLNRQTPGVNLTIFLGGVVNALMVSLESLVSFLRSEAIISYYLNLLILLFHVTFRNGVCVIL